MSAPLNSAGQKIAIHQFHPYAMPGDAITQQMFFIQKSLRDIGVEGEIFSRKFPSTLTGKVKAFDSKLLWDSDLLLIHHSLGYPQLSEILRVEIPKALVYHNVTPPEFFSHNPVVKNMAIKGRAQLKTLKRHLIASFADSQYNADELETLGYPASPVLPLFDLEHLENNLPQGFAKKTPRKGTLRLLFVGRMAPHKNQAGILEMFRHLKNLVPAHLELVLVGGGDPIYIEYIKLLRKQLGLNLSVQILGHIDDKKRDTLYRTSDAFVCLSKHEGFCVPLVEAMEYGLPVFAPPQTAIAETLGNAGVHLLTPDDPRKTAEVIAAVLQSAPVKEVVVDSQRKRLAELAQIQNPKRVQDLLSALVHEIRNRPERVLGAQVPAAW